MTEKPAITPELKEAVWSTMYYDERSSPVIIEMLTGRTFATPPLPPTEEQKAMAREIVEGLLFLYHNALDDTIGDTTGRDTPQGEEIDLGPFSPSMINIGGI
jgi:hypothetical protein